MGIVYSSHMHVHKVDSLAARNCWINIKVIQWLQQPNISHDLTSRMHEMNVVDGMSTNQPAESTHHLNSIDVANYGWLIVLDLDMFLTMGDRLF